MKIVLSFEEFRKEGRFLIQKLQKSMFVEVGPMDVTLEPLTSVESPYPGMGGAFQYITTGFNGGGGDTQKLVDLFLTDRCVGTILRVEDSGWWCFTICRHQEVPF